MKCARERVVCYIEIYTERDGCREALFSIHLFLFVCSNFNRTSLWIFLWELSHEPHGDLIDLLYLITLKSTCKLQFYLYSKLKKKKIISIERAIRMFRQIDCNLKQ